jgi:putative peptidoglycan lipid II flippase
MKKIWVNYWHKLTKGSVNRQIFRAIFTVAIFTAGVKLVATAKEIAVAWRFGTNEQLDAFLIALIVPGFAINVIAESLNAALIPTYIRVRDREGIKAAHQLFSSATVFSTLLLIIATCIIAATAPLYLKLIASGFSWEKLHLTRNLLWFITPLVILSGVRTIWGAVLNAGEKFAIAAVTPIAIPGISILLLFLVPSWGVFALAIGLVLGTLVELILLGSALHRQKIPLIPGWFRFDTNLRQVIDQYIPTISGAVLICSAMPIDQSMAAILSPGSVAALNYSNRLIASFISLMTIALGTAVIPYFSKMIAADNWRDLQGTVHKYLGLVFMITIPLSIGLIVFSEPITRLMFERGSFNASDTQTVASIQNFYALQIPFYLGNILMVRIINSLNKNQILFWLSLANLFFNILFNYLFMKIIGIQGIALSTSFVYIFSFSFTLIFTRRIIKEKLSTLT